LPNDEEIGLMYAKLGEIEQDIIKKIEAKEETEKAKLIENKNNIAHQNNDEEPKTKKKNIFSKVINGFKDWWE
jgi:hypothetical protein